MPNIVSIDKTIDQLELNLTRLKFVKENFPKVKVNFDKRKNIYLFSDRIATNNFTDFELVVLPHINGLLLITK